MKCPNVPLIKMSGAPLGRWLRELRAERGLPLRVVAEAAAMDLSHLHKIELGRRLPTEDQARKLAKFFGIKETDILARRIAAKFQNEFAGHPAATNAILMLAEEAGVYSVARRGGKSIRE